MTGKTIVVLGCLYASASGLSAYGQRFEPGSPALFQGSTRIGWGAGLFGGWDRRRFSDGEDSLRLDLQRIRVRFSVDALPGTDLWVEGGATECQVSDLTKDWGTEWALGADLYVFEHPIRSSPVTGRREWIGLNLTGSTRRTRVDYDDTDLQWREWRMGAVARYGRKEDPETALRLFSTMGQSFRVGLVRSRVRGEYGPDRLRQSSRLGFLLGADVLWPSDWVMRMEALAVGSGNQELTLAVSRYF